MKTLASVKQNNNGAFISCTNAISFITCTVSLSLSIKKANTSCLTYKHHQQRTKTKTKNICVSYSVQNLYFYSLFPSVQFILQRAILGLLWEPKPDLRRRGLHRHPVPANTALAHLVAVDVLARDRVRGLA